MKKNLKITAVIFFVMFSACFFLACGPYEGYDDDDKIINGTDFSSTINSTESDLNNKYIFSASKFNGQRTVASLSLPENPSLKVTLTIKSGRFKLVLIKDETVYLVTDSDAGGTVETCLSAGTYKAKIVGQDAEMSFSFDYSEFK